MSDFNENVNQELVEKWGAVLDEKVDGRSIEDSQKRALTAIMLENTEKELAKQSGENSYLQKQRCWFYA
jgi:hypothetical protein